MLEVKVNKRLNLKNGTRDIPYELTVSTGEFILISGVSGAGKTTLFRLVAGLEKPDQGTIAFAGQVWNDTQQKLFIVPQVRNIGFVFQDYALFPNMTVRRNVEYGLREKDVAWVVELLKVLELEGLAEIYPEKLSGGQQQRVALARALAGKPKLLLLDEPFSALDKAMRETLRSYIEKIHKEFGLTTMVISHYSDEWKQQADRHLEMREEGLTEIQQRGVKLSGKVVGITGNLVTIDLLGKQTSMEMEEENVRNLQVGDEVNLKIDGK